MSMRVGLYGGAFDPPHLGHLKVAQTALWSDEIDTLWFLPAWSSASGKNMSEFKHRLFMCSLLSKNYIGMHVCDLEAEVKSLDSLEIVNYIQEQNLACSFRLVLGTDNFWKMNQWKNSHEVMKIAPALWVERPGQSRIPVISYPLYNTLSSTQVRETISSNGSMDGLVSKEVETYIKDENLYNG